CFCTHNGLLSKRVKVIAPDVGLNLFGIWNEVYSIRGMKCTVCGRLWSECSSRNRLVLVAEALMRISGEVNVGPLSRVETGVTPRCWNPRSGTLLFFFFVPYRRRASGRMPAKLTFTVR
ncbi:unnamed protein product, partial [Ectocarpus sp. 13 AM-2016]